MIKTTARVSLALLCLCQAAFAQDLKTTNHATRRVAANNEPFDASVARLATKAAFQPASKPTQQELLGLILLMSLRERQANRT